MGKCVWTILFIPFVLFGTVKHSSFVDHDTASHPIQVNASAPPFKGLILLENKADLNPAGYHDVHGVMSYHVDLPGGTVELKQRVRIYYNQPLDKETITEIKKRVIQYYQNHDRPVVTISVPHQDISTGVLQLVITEGKLGKIYCKGNKWFKSDRLEEAIQLEPGGKIASDILNQNLYWLNKNPFRHIDGIYTPGEEEGTTDVELICSDRFPLRIYAGIDNTGNDVTGNNRLFTGFNWGNVFWSDQRLSYQFVSSSDFKRYWAHTAFYEVPLPWQHMLNIYGGYSHVDADFAVPDIEGSMFHTHGFSVQGSLRYDIPLKPYKNFLHEITWGFDFKRTNNNLDLGGVPIISENNVNLTQLMLGYNMGFESPPLSISLEIEGFWSPRKWISDQTNADYESLRPFAKNQYVYTRTALTFIWRFYKDWSIHNYFRGQLANINLLPSEEYGIGGYNTVRGYKERIVNGDAAFIWNLEFRTPPVSILNALAGWKKFHDEIQFLVFYDYGLSGVKQTAPSQDKTTYLMSFGPGVRYNIIPYLTFRADWGFQLHNLHLGGPYQRLHFALIVGY
ncbi:ShlB/FhaC/HecB family hemolysin secretion/activation protein [Candidatus Neptunichlamydia sp. REUL1]|uniref:ShlB/FhaC/HecB family hemolysin secretion/activation protein n=1 Tax=Candidatus Neptunichlamydia sp. REUL1 TaxID=3064277 RepID=UPI00292FC841|nr:ShlB/FhaC/HecB family hemolysin secretion/activation protein [Candidatus Neptunochlamydia sp. REUL1]